MANSRDFTGKNRKFTGTKGIVTPKGTTGERVGSESGELRFNTTTELMEYYDGTQWKPIDAPPTISSITTSDGTGTNTILNADGSTLYTITINGGNFSVGATVRFIGSTGTEYTATNVTRVSASQITCTTLNTMGTTDDPYDVRVINTSSLAATLDDAFSYNAAPVFVNASGQLAVVYSDGSQTFSGSTINAGATDAEGNAITHTIISGSLPAGLSIASSTGYITGTVTGTPSLGNYSFVVRAATTEGTVERQFSLQVAANPFVAATGGTVLTSGDFKTHVFTSPGSFVVANAGSPSGSTSVEYLVVAGGAGGSGGHGGGGGAGGYRQNFPSPVTGGLPVSATTYPVTVGGGGNGGVGPRGSPSIFGASGGNSVFSTITSTGGGGGAYSNNDGNPADLGQPGGSGGGGGSAGGGTGNSPPVSPPQGNPGAGGSPGGSPIYQGGGSGGAGGSGSSDGTSGIGSPISTTFFGPTAPSYGTPGPVAGRYFAGGGGGGIHNGPTPSNATAGGGGRGGTNTPSAVRGDNGTVNTGGGGGGTAGPGPRGGDGGSGIVAIRYKFQ